MVEKAPYTIIKSLDTIEFRLYPPMILAVVEGYERDSGFNLLFQYISGENSSQQKISMTAPVITSEKIPMTAPVITKQRYMAFVFLVRAEFVLLNFEEQGQFPLCRMKEKQMPYIVV